MKLCRKKQVIIRKLRTAENRKTRAINSTFEEKKETQSLPLKKRLEASQKYKEAHITQDYAKAIQEQRKKTPNQNAEVINRTLYINNEA